MKNTCYACKMKQMGVKSKRPFSHTCKKYPTKNRKHIKLVEPIIKDELTRLKLKHKRLNNEVLFFQLKDNRIRCFVFDSDKKLLSVKSGSTAEIAFKSCLEDIATNKILNEIINQKPINLKNI